MEQIGESFLSQREVLFKEHNPGELRVTEVELQKSKNNSDALLNFPRKMLITRFNRLPLTWCEGGETFFNKRHPLMAD